MDEKITTYTRKSEIREILSEIMVPILDKIKHESETQEQNEKRQKKLEQRLVDLQTALRLVKTEMKDMMDSRLDWERFRSNFDELKNSYQGSTSEHFTRL